MWLPPRRSRLPCLSRLFLRGLLKLPPQIFCNSPDACPDRGTSTIRVTTYAVIFGRFASCMRDRQLLWAARVFCWPSETIGGRLVSELVTVRPPRRTLHRPPSHLTTASVMLAQAA